MYGLILNSPDGSPSLEITRTYTLAPDRFDLRCINRFTNRGTTPLTLTWEQYAQGDPPNDDAAYLGDRRMLFGGYQDLSYDSTGKFIYTKNAQVTRSEVLDGEPFWPNPNLPEKRNLVWLAGVNRYFAAAVHPIIHTDDPDTSVIPLDEDFPKLTIKPVGARGQTRQDNRSLTFALTSNEITIAPGQSAELGLALFVGPRKKELFDQPPYDTLQFTRLIIYELGCTLCTFQPLAKGLLGFLKILHSITYDWGIAIVILVLVVRLILHPITKKAQINMMRMGKQMQAIQPELEKLKKKYKDNQQRFQQEQIKLFREKNINPANMLGCLPMFLQTPIWIALYAMLYYAIELRHQPAFYGFFQAISGGNWGFLGDLSSPDHFIRFTGEGFTLPLFFINPTFAGINVIPILMAVVFYIQQKFTTPPPANEQAAQQQKIMKYMVLLFPIFLYSAPSGLTLYILASTCAGIIDGYVVRRHIKREEEAGTLLTPKPRKPGGLMDRLQKAVEAKQQQMQAQQAASGKRPSGKGPRPKRPKR